MQNIIKSFINNNITQNYLNDEFDYSFNNKSNILKFNIEYKKFLGLYNILFYNGNRFVTAINSYEIRLKVKDIDHLLKLYLYSKENNLYNEKIILTEFIYTYYNTINSTIYMQNYLKYNESRNEFITILKKHKLEIEFFNNFINNIYEFYRNILILSINNESFIDTQLISRIFNNLRRNQKYYNALIKILVDNKKNLQDVIMLDNNKKNHREIYVKYILDSLNNFKWDTYIEKMINQLDKSECLNTVILNNIINKYIDIVNKECTKLKNKQYSFIQGLSEIETIKKQLLYILQNIESLNANHKDKIHQCLIQLFRLKRYMLSDKKYIMSEMHEESFKYEISKEEVEEIKKIIFDNKFSIYSISRIKFCKELENSLEIYSRYPIQSLVSRYKIDSANQIYAVSIENMVRQNNNFKSYYDKMGSKYTIDHPKLINKLSMNYYEELLTHLSKVFSINQNIILATLGEDDFERMITELKKDLSYDFYNNYAIIVSNIMSIEWNVMKILKKKNIEGTSDEFENLNLLFKIYDSDEIKDGIMYINYILYEKSGLNLRNNALHGSLITTDLHIPLLVTFCGLIFISWLLNNE